MNSSWSVCWLNSFHCAEILLCSSKYYCQKDALNLFVFFLSFLSFFGPPFHQLFSCAFDFWCRINFNIQNSPISAIFLEYIAREYTCLDFPHACIVLVYLLKYFIYIKAINEMAWKFVGWILWQDSSLLAHLHYSLLQPLKQQINSHWLCLEMEMEMEAWVPN